MKRHFSILTKFLVLLFFIASIVISVSVYFTSSQQINYFKNINLNKALTFAQTFDATISEKDISDPTKIQENIYKYLLINPDIEKIIISVYKNNRLLIVASSDLTLLGKSASTYSINSFQSDQSINHNLDQNNGDNLLIVDTPMHLSGKSIGVYEMYLSNKESENTITKEIAYYVIFTIIGLFVLFVGSFILFKLVITNPINKLIRGAKAVGEGNLETQVSIKSNDEFGELAGVFNNMIFQLKAFRDNLEIKVVERTNDLAKKIKEIESNNKDLEDNKLAMFNLLEDSRELEEKLKIEKENVEKKVEERTQELFEEKTKLTSSIENLPIGFMLLDTQGQLVISNNQVKDILEKTIKEDMINELSLILSKKVDLKKYVKDCGKDKKRLVFNDLIKNDRFLRVLLSPILTGQVNDECIGVVVLIEDITEAKILERSKDEFFSIASHELRTPLTAIRGNTDLIIQYFSEQLKDPQLKEMVADIHESSVRLIHIVNDFLNVGRLEQGRLEFKPTTFDLVSLADRAVREYQVTGSRSKIAINVFKPEDLIPKVFADEDKVRQVLINLIGNALKFTIKGGIKITFKKEEKVVRTYVSDTGQGIPLNNQPLLFHKFQQAGSSIYTRDTTKGTGLGLYISKLMLKEMGGTIRLESSVVDKGTTFSFTVPIAKQG